MSRYSTSLKVVEWEDETSIFDPKGYWSFGCDCNVRLYKALVPVNMVNDDEIQDFIENNPDCYI